jgi:hypothetical protein
MSYFSFDFFQKVGRNGLHKTATPEDSEEILEVSWSIGYYPQHFGGLS